MMRAHSPGLSVRAVGLHSPVGNQALRAVMSARERAIGLAPKKVSLGDVGQTFGVLRPVRAIPAAGVIAVTAERPSQKPGGSFHG